MKKHMSLLLIVLLLVGMVLTTATAMASTDPADMAKPPHPTKEPRVNATEPVIGPVLEVTESPDDEDPTDEPDVDVDVEETGEPKGPKDPKSTKEPKATKEPKVTGESEENQKPKRLHFRGFVDTADDTSLTILLKDGGETVSFVVNAETTVKIPTLWQCSTCSDLLPGVQVLVQAVQDENGELVALTVHVIPGKPTKMHRVGEVTDYQEGASITILAKDGQEYTFLLTDETLVLPLEGADLLETGAWVTIISPRDVTGQPATARAIVVHLLDDDSDTDEDGDVDDDNGDVDDDDDDTGDTGDDTGDVDTGDDTGDTGDTGADE